MFAACLLIFRKNYTVRTLTSCTVFSSYCVRRGLDVCDVTMQAETLMCMMLQSKQGRNMYAVTMQAETLLCVLLQ